MRSQFSNFNASLIMPSGSSASSSSSFPQRPPRRRAQSVGTSSYGSSLALASSTPRGSLFNAVSRSASFMFARDFLLPGLQMLRHKRVRTGTVKISQLKAEQRSHGVIRFRRSRSVVLLCPRCQCNDGHRGHQMILRLLGSFFSVSHTYPVGDGRISWALKHGDSSLLMMMLFCLGR